MCLQDDGNPSLQLPHGPNRRAFLRTAGLAGAGAAALGAMTAAPASAAVAPSASLGEIGTWNPDPTSPRFTLAVMPDTQFMPSRSITGLTFLTCSAPERHPVLPGSRYLPHLAEARVLAQQPSHLPVARPRSFPLVVRAR